MNDLFDNQRAVFVNTSDGDPFFNFTPGYTIQDFKDMNKKNWFFFQNCMDTVMVSFKLILESISTTQPTIFNFLLLDLRNNYYQAYVNKTGEVIQSTTKVKISQHINKIITFLHIKKDYQH